MEVVGAMVAGVAVDPGERNMRRRVVEGGRKEQPTSIIPHTSTTAGGGESGAHLLSGFVLAVVGNPLCPADTQLCRQERRGMAMQEHFKILPTSTLDLSLLCTNSGQFGRNCNFAVPSTVKVWFPHLSRQADSLVQALAFSQPLGTPMGCRVTKRRCRKGHQRWFSTNTKRSFADNVSILATKQIMKNKTKMFSILSILS